MTQRERLADEYPDLMVMDEFDNCIVGIAYGINREPIVVYDIEAVIMELRNQGMDEEEAYEFFEYNQLGSYVGDKTPLFLDRLD